MKYFAYPMRGSMLALKTILLSVFCLILAAPALAQRAFDVQLWQKKAPNSNALGDTAYVKVFLPEEKRATGRAVVICLVEATRVCRWGTKAPTGLRSSTIKHSSHRASLSYACRQSEGAR